jgi:hypothetical protein
MTNSGFVAIDGQHGNPYPVINVLRSLPTGAGIHQSHRWSMDKTNIYKGMTNGYNHQVHKSTEDRNKAGADQRAGPRHDVGSTFA